VAKSGPPAKHYEDVKCMLSQPPCLGQVLWLTVCALESLYYIPHRTNVSLFYCMWWFLNYRIIVTVKTHEHH